MYEVRFEDEFGHVIKSQEVAYGTGATNLPLI